MKAIKYFFFVVLLAFSSKLLSQDQTILIFDPNGVSTSFQYTLSQLTEDSVFVADSLDDTIFNYDGLFLFINPPFALSQEEGNRLIQYTSGGNPVYLFTSIFPGGLDTVDFWNHIGIDDMSGLLISVPIDTVFGVSGQFTDGVVIDTSFMSGLIPVIVGNVDSILIGDAEFWEVNTTYLSGYDSLNVIIDLYNLIDDSDFLQEVLEYFELQPPNYVDEKIISLTEFILSQNYPNPFNPVTKIEFRIADFGFVSLKVYDILGNEIATLVDEEKPAGSYEVEFNSHSGEGRNLPSGVYFYQLRIGGPETSSGQGFIETKKMILLK